MSELYIVKAKKTVLKSPLSTTASSVTLKELIDSQGNDIVMASFGAFGVIVVTQASTVEMIKFTNLSRAVDGTVTLTVATNGRDIAPVYPYAGSSTGQKFNATADVIVTNDPLTMMKFGLLNNANLWDMLQSFAVVPETTGGNATSANQLVRKAQLDASVLGIATSVSIIVEGTAGETIVDGNLLYLNIADNRWWKADADTASTVENVILGIAQGAGNAGNPITNGIMLRGVDDAQTGLTAGAKYYASNTAGGISVTVGTKEVTVGIAKSTTSIYFEPRFDQQLTEDQQDAMDNAVTPNATNPFMTKNDLGLTGIISPYAGFTAPAGWLICDGSAVSRATYPALFSLINPALGVATMTIASPAVVSFVGHGLVLDDTIYFTTSGLLPTGVAINTKYYVISAGLTADAFQFSATKGGTAIVSTGSQSGTHTLSRSPYGVGNGTTTFNLPNLKGSVPVGRDSTQTEFNAVGETGGEKTHALTTPELASHSHTTQYSQSGAGSTPTPTYGQYGVIGATLSSDTSGSGTAHNNLQPYIALNYIIRY